jgi:ketosteroid isomerase-like protein
MRGSAAPQQIQTVALCQGGLPITAVRRAESEHAAGTGPALHRLTDAFSDCTSYAFELQAYDVVEDMAYTAGLEHTSASVDGQPRSYTLRATQVYRREGGEWNVVHRHADTVTE